MADNRVTLTRADVQRQLPKLHEHLSRADSDRLDRILPLFRSAGNAKANLAECLDAVSPNKKGDRQKQQADFRQFRQHLRTAFDKARLGIELTVDSRKRDDATARECWFTAPPINRTVARIEAFSHSAAGDAETKAVEPMGVDPNLIGRPAVRCCILAASQDSLPATRLAELLRSAFDAQSEFIYDVWDRESVVAGENPNELQREAIRNSDVLLLFASPAFLADDQLKSSINKTTAHTIPVLLKPIAAGQDQSCLDECELFQLHLPRAGNKSFQECKGEQRDQFAQKLFELIHQLILDRGATPPRPTLDDETARELTLLFPADDPDDPIEPRGTQARFGEDVTKRATDTDTAGAVPMFKALDDWIRNPEGAVYAAVLGESGIGKTTLLKTQTLHLIDARRQDPSLPLPIYIDLRLFMPTIQEQKKVPTDLVELLDEILPRAKHRGDVSGISGEDIIKLVQQDGAILIFDGLDEKLVHLDENPGVFFDMEADPQPIGDLKL
ncbi:MAG: hypothetical protein IH991_06515, partial [Planctomycetes bacterium]|nr:hypothetical protein [Planctomycetota bacterium]